MKSRRVASFAEEGKWTSGADSTMLIGDWQAWVDGEGHWKVRGPDPDNEAHYAGGDIELTEAEDIEAGNSAARRKIRARRAKEAARTYIKSMLRTSKPQHATKKSAAQLDREIAEALAGGSSSSAFEEAKTEQALLEAESDAAGAALKVFPKGPMGLTPDVVRATPEYRAAKARSDKAFQRLRDFNGVFTKRFAKELRAERDARYADRTSRARR